MSEQKGQCRREITAAYESTRYKPSDSAMLTADAIDRLAADVATVKEVVQRILPSAVLCERDAAIRERDAANQRRADTVRRLVQAQAEVAQLRDSRDVANRLFGAEQAKVERLRKELEQRQPDGNSSKTPNSSPAAPQPAGHGISPGLPETQSAGNAAPPAGWLTDRERRAVAYFAQVCRDDLVPDEWTDNAGVLRSLLARAGSPPSQTAAGWLTEEERRVLQNHAESLREQRFALERGGQAVGYSVNPGLLKREADLIDAMLARAGSPPVVEVPDLPSNFYARSEAERYRAAMDKAGVAWKEVPRE